MSQPEEVLPLQAHEIGFLEKVCNCNGDQSYVLNRPGLVMEQMLLRG